MLTAIAIAVWTAVHPPTPTFNTGEEVLAEWVRQCEGVECVSFQSFVWNYDLTFGFERRGVEDVFLTRDNLGFLNRRPSDIEQDAVSRRLRANGKPFTVRPMISHTLEWSVNGFEFKDPENKLVTRFRYTRFPRADKVGMTGWLDQLLLPVMNPSALQFRFMPGRGNSGLLDRNRFTFEIVRQTSELIYLRISPQWTQDQVNCKNISVIFQKHPRLQLTAIRCQLPGNSEVTRTFQDVVFNDPRNATVELPTDFERVEFDYPVPFGNAGRLFD